MVQHVFAEIALTAVGARGGVVAVHVAVFAAGDIFAGAGGDIVGAADRVVIAACVDDGRLSPLEAARKQRCGEQECDEQLCGVTSHAPIFRGCSGFVIAGQKREARLRAR